MWRWANRLLAPVKQKVDRTILLRGRPQRASKAIYAAWHASSAESANSKPASGTANIACLDGAVLIGRKYEQSDERDATNQNQEQKRYANPTK